MIDRGELLGEGWVQGMGPVRIYHHTGDTRKLIVEPTRSDRGFFPVFRKHVAWKRSRAKAAASEQENVPWDSRWKEIPKFPGYWVSQYGQVFNMKRGALMALYRNQHGVLSVRMYGRLSKDGSRGYSRSVPKLVRELHGLRKSKL